MTRRATRRRPNRDEQRRPAAPWSTTRSGYPRLERRGHPRPGPRGNRAGSVALAGFGLDSLIEIGASTVVLWELAGTGEKRQRRALRLIAVAFLALAAYLTVQAVVVVALDDHPEHSPLGIIWTAITALVMFALALGKKRVGVALQNPVLTAESRVTVIDGLLAGAVLLGLVLNACSAGGGRIRWPAWSSFTTRSGKLAPFTRNVQGRSGNKRA